MNANDIIIVKVIQVSTGATNEIIQAGARSSQEVIDWHRIVGRNQTDSTTRIELGLKQNSGTFLVRAANQAALGRTVATQMDFPASGDFAPYALFSDPDSGDVLELLAYGHLVQADMP